MSKLTNQQIYDRVRDHLIAQGKPSVDSTNQCAYRGEGDLKCAAGCLIEDSEYSPDFEGRSTLGADIEDVIDGKCADIFGGPKLIRQLQRIHDSYVDHLSSLHPQEPGVSFVDHIRPLLEQCALNYGLQP